MKRIVRVFTEWSEDDKARGMHLPRILLLCAAILLATVVIGLIFQYAG